MNVVADTRYKKPIWIDWDFDKVGQIKMKFQEFELVEEAYDAAVVFHYLTVRSVVKKEGFLFSYVYSKAASYYKNKLGGDEQFSIIEASMGFKRASDRRSYARSLLRPKFID